MTLYRYSNSSSYSSPQILAKYHDNNNIDDVMMMISITGKVTKLQVEPIAAPLSANEPDIIS